MSTNNRKHLLDTMGVGALANIREISPTVMGLFFICLLFHVGDHSALRFLVRTHPRTIFLWFSFSAG